MFIWEQEEAQTGSIIRRQCQTNAQGVRERNDEESRKGEKNNNVQTQFRWFFFFLKQNINDLSFGSHHKAREEKLHSISQSLRKHGPR